jgi:hypothetical protein
VRDAGWMTPPTVATCLRGAEAKRPAMAVRPKRFADSRALPAIDQTARPSTDETTGRSVRAPADRLDASRPAFRIGIVGTELLQAPLPTGNVRVAPV